MSKKSERPVYAFIRDGNILRPEMDYDTHALDGVKQGQRVRVEIGQWRNLGRLRAYWCTLQDCVDATGCAPHKEALDAYVRPAVGHVDIVRLANGQYQATPRHINTRDCDEPEMIAFFLAVEECLAREFGFVSERKINDNSHPGEPPSAGNDDPTASESSTEREQVSSPDSANDRSAEPTPSQEQAERSSPLPNKFNFTEQELVDLKDCARKMLTAAAKSNLSEGYRTSDVAGIQLGYSREALVSEDAKQALAGIRKVVDAVVRNPARIWDATQHIASEFLNCTQRELEGRGNG